MRCAIMQPTYLPWIGYFDLMDQVDVFVLLDDVQFSRGRSWQQRNRIKTKQGLQWLTLPVVRRFPERINEVELSDRQIGETHTKTIQGNYSRAAHFRTYFPEIREVMVTSTQMGRLLEVNRQLIECICTQIKIDTPVLLASEVGGEGSRSERLANLCMALQATTYISPPGSATYLLEELQEFNNRGIEVVFHHYKHPIYQQLFPPFLPQASIVDLLLNEGPYSLDIIRSGRRPPWSVLEMQDQVQVAAEQEIV